MTTAATAKLLLFIALSLGSQSKPGTILATSNSDNYAWSNENGSWALETKGLPADGWNHRGEQSYPESSERREYRAIAHHHWQSEPILDLEDGNQVMKRDGATFYIEHPGAPNQKVFTILYPDCR